MPHSSPGSEIDWRRIYPQPTHRWYMGVRHGDLAKFFADNESSAAARAERDHWLTTDPQKYTALLPEALPALRDTVELARGLGVEIDAAADPHSQLLALGRAWEPDFVWMHPTPEGQHRLIGGVVCFPSRWSLHEKLGHPMTEIHAPVPGLNELLAKPIEAFMARQKPGEVWVRENVNFARDQRLNYHPDQPHTPIDETISPEEFWFRFEHQLLLKLSPSGSVLFGIRIEILPLAKVSADPFVAQRLADIFETMSPDAARYKGIASARDRLVAICRDAGQGQP